MTEQVAAADWVQRARDLRRDGWWLADLCGVDRLGLGGERFEVVVQLLHRERKERITLHIAAEADPPTVPSVVEVFPTATFMEREAFDLFGISFDGHPNLTRILMPEEWEGHPLRKDYGVGKVPIQFIPQPYLQIDAPGQEPDSIDARTEVDRLGQPAPADSSGNGRRGTEQHSAGERDGD